MYKKVYDISRRLVAISLVILLAVPAIRADSEQINPEDSVTIVEEIEPQAPPGDSEKKPKTLEQEKSLDLGKEDVPQEEQQEEPIEPVSQDADAPDVKTEDSPQEEKKTEGETPKEPIENESFFEKCRRKASEYYEIVSTFVVDNKIPFSIVGGIITFYFVALFVTTAVFAHHVSKFANDYRLDPTSQEVKEAVPNITFSNVLRHPVKSWKWFAQIDKLRREYRRPIFKR